MKQTFSLASKINVNALRYELVIASYAVGSKFEEIFKSRDLYVVLNFTSSHKKF